MEGEAGDIDNTRVAGVLPVGCFGGSAEAGVDASADVGAVVTVETAGTCFVDDADEADGAD